MIPTINDLKSDALTHQSNDLFNPPGLANNLGTVQVTEDITAIRGLNFPPLGAAAAITGALYFNDRYFTTYDCPVTYSWYPDKIIRTAICQGHHLRSTTILAVDQRAALISLQIENRSGTESRPNLSFRTQGAPINTVKGWADFIPPTGAPVQSTTLENDAAYLYRSRDDKAVLVHGFSQQPAKMDQNWARFSFTLAAGERRTISQVLVLSDDTSLGIETYRRLRKKTDAAITAAADYWNAELKAVFTPGNDRYSGSLPILDTDNKDLQKLYWLGIMGVIYFKRDNPASVYGRAYDTLLPRYWQTVTFVWDYSLSSLVHALLDPAVMRKYLEYWMGMDIHRHFGSDYLTGGPVGPWYSVNDFAMCWMSNDYLRWTGDRQWMKSTIQSWQTNKPPQKVLDYLLDYANNWQQFKTGNGLADYGGIDNLLECVSTYIHQVASLNAGNVFNLRMLAEVLENLGQEEKAGDFHSQARGLLEQVKDLYVEGGGYWQARYPNGRRVDVRHCYDFITILNTIAADLSDRQQMEMLTFFREELQTETWMRALSPQDRDAIFSIRPDHQWNGAYPAWPAQAVSGLFKLGQPDLALEWIRGLAKSANQGPFGQAHFVESAAPVEDGGARKSPPNSPYITDWAVSSGGSWVNLVIEGLFGVQASTYGGITAVPQFGKFDHKAELINLNFQGRLYNVTKKGLREQ